MKKGFFISTEPVMFLSGGTPIGPVSETVTEAEFWERIEAIAGGKIDRDKIEDHLSTPTNILNIGTKQFSLFLP